MSLNKPKKNKIKTPEELIMEANGDKSKLETIETSNHSSIEAKTYSSKKETYKLKTKTFRCDPQKTAVLKKLAADLEYETGEKYTQDRLLDEALDFIIKKYKKYLEKIES